jgi:predicted NBD/HSP70 family sugar kinase
MSEADEGPLGAARQRRIELKQAMSATEIAAAAAAGDPTWRGDLRAALDDLRRSWDHHVEEVEGPDGLLPELVGKAPRLAPKVARLDDEHSELRTRIDETIGHLDAGEVADLRAEVLDVLVAIARHRQLGADLVYDAYHVDIGGE